MRANTSQHVPRPLCEQNELFSRRESDNQRNMPLPKKRKKRRKESGFRGALGSRRLGLSRLMLSSSD